MLHLTVIPCEKCIVRQFCQCVNITECIYTNLDDIAYTNPGYIVQLIDSRLQACTVCFCTKQQEIISSKRENK